MALTKITAKYLEQFSTYGAQSSVVTAIKANLDAAYNAIDGDVTNLAKLKSGTVNIASGATNGTNAIGAGWNGKPVNVTLQSAAGALAAAVVQVKAVIAAGVLTVTLIDKNGTGVAAGSNLVFSFTADAR